MVYLVYNQMKGSDNMTGYYEVTISNGVWEETKEVPFKYAESAEQAERMVNGLINSAWHVVAGKTREVA
jgi:hypothetical protein